MFVWRILPVGEEDKHLWHPERSRFGLGWEGSLEKLGGGGKWDGWLLPQDHSYIPQVLSMLGRFRSPIWQPAQAAHFPEGWVKCQQGWACYMGVSVCSIKQIISFKMFQGSISWISTVVHPTSSFGDEIMISANSFGTGNLYHVNIGMK